MYGVIVKLHGRSLLKRCIVDRLDFIREFLRLAKESAGMRAMKKIGIKSSEELRMHLSKLGEYELELEMENKKDEVTEVPVVKTKAKKPQVFTMPLLDKPVEKESLDEE